MSSETDTKLDPSEQAASATEPQKNTTETAKVTENTSQENEKPATSGMASSAAERARETATGAASAAGTAATSAKDNVFSMFGGGAKKEKKEEVEQDDEPSGSSKKKEGEDVRLPFVTSQFLVHSKTHELTQHSRTKIPRLVKTCTLSLSYTLQRRLSQRRMKRRKNKCSRCEPSSSGSTETLRNGRREALVM